MARDLWYIAIALVALGGLALWVSWGLAWRWRALGATLALLLAAGIYLAVGTPAAISPPLDPVEALAAQIEARLDEDPTDLDGWRALGRLRIGQGRYDAAADAFAKARALAGDEDAAALIGYAEARLLADPSRLTGEVAPLLERALELAPRDLRALWYAGHLANERGDRALAEERWRALLALEPSPDLRHAVEMQLGGAPAAGSGQPLFELEIEIAPALAASLPRGAPLFVFVREGTGRIPLIAKRIAPFTLPLKVVLTDGDLLGGAEALAGAASLTAGARVAASGSASRGPGDLEGTAAIVRGEPGRARLVIDAVVE
jgi:cytochrome c-type biogenesis protein CcmH